MTAAGAGLAMGKAPKGNSSNMQLATIVAVGAQVTAQIDGSDTTFTLICDVDRIEINPATVGDRVLCTRQGSSMYEIALVSSAYATPLSGSFAAYGLTANQSLAASTEATIIFNSSIQTRVNFAAPTLGIFTIPVTGLYVITARVGFALATAGVRRYAALYINGATDIRTENSSQNPGQWYVQVNDIRQMTAGDTIGLRGFHAEAGAINAVAFDVGGTVPGTSLKIAQLG